MNGLQAMIRCGRRTGSFRSMPANWSDPSFSQITHRFDRVHAHPEHKSGATVRNLMVVIGAVTGFDCRSAGAVDVRLGQSLRVICRRAGREACVGPAATDFCVAAECSDVPRPDITM
jgi:hypothetical protein